MERLPIIWSEIQVSYDTADFIKVSAERGIEANEFNVFGLVWFDGLEQRSYEFNCNLTITY